MTIAPELTTVVTDRERFCTMLANSPLVPGDAIVCLCGEDIQARVAVAGRLLVTGAAPLILMSGGHHEPPRHVGAEQAFPELLAQGIAYDRILLETKSPHTRGQAEAIVAMAVEREWHTLLLVASAYHMPRAFLTVLHVADERGVSDRLRLVNASVTHMPWLGSPDGIRGTRLDMLAREFEKIRDYQQHVATYARGVEYLAYWEAKTIAAAEAGAP